MLSHVSLGTTDLDRARVFYDAALAPIGYVQVWHADTALGYGSPGGNDELAIKLRDDVGVALAAGPGFHVAFAAPSRAAVDVFHRAALEHGGRCNGSPGRRPHYSSTYYAGFVIDPDGHHLEAVHQ